MGGSATLRCGLFNGAGAGYINSIQYVTITIGAGASSNTATISAVDTSKCFLVYLGQSCDGADGIDGTIDNVRVTLTNSTTLTATSNSASVTTSRTISVAVIDAKSTLINSVQYGTISISAATSNTATITSVDTSRSAVIFLGMTNTSSAGTVRQWFTSATLTNATTVTATASITATLTVGFAVVEFASAAIQSRQQFASSKAGTNTTDTQTITSVTANNALCFWGGVTLNANSIPAGYTTNEITSSTNVNLIRNTGTSLTRVMNFTVIEFASGVLKSAVQRGTINLVSATSNTATISSVNTAKTMLSIGGLRTAETTNQPQYIHSRITLTNGTTITANRASSAANDNIIAYEAVEFN